MFGRPPYTGLQAPQPSTNLTSLSEHDMLSYCKKLSSELSQVQVLVRSALPVPAEGPLHSLQPGDWILVRDFRQKHWKQRRRRGPFQVNFSRDTNTSMVQKNVVFRLRNLSNPFFIPQLCFHSPVTEHTRYHLGHTSGWNITLKVACTPSLLTHVDAKTNVTTTYNVTVALTPSDYGYGCPTDMVWTCGQHSYLYLPARWAGTCHLSYLIPAVSKLTISPFMSPPHTRVKWDRISGDHKFAISIIPLYGPARLAWYIEELSVELENLTASVEQGFDTLTSEMKALRTISLQNRAALDLLLAEKGGVCHLIGDQCCTYVPDITANMSDVHNQLDHLRRVLHEENTAYSTTGWDFWGWLLSGGWRALLVKTQTSTFWTHHPCTYSKCPCAFKTWNALIVLQSRMQNIVKNTHFGLFIFVFIYVFICILL
uniref:Uncharacterized protein n=1 Tax=Sphaeramia orbicularis TaxID=375764 RepID=A0A673AQG3_9TELE